MKRLLFLSLALQAYCAIIDEYEDATSYKPPLSQPSVHVNISHFPSPIKNYTKETANTNAGSPLLTSTRPSKNSTESGGKSNVNVSNATTTTTNATRSNGTTVNVRPTINYNSTVNGNTKPVADINATVHSNTTQPAALTIENIAETVNGSEHVNKSSSDVSLAEKVNGTDAVHVYKPPNLGNVIPSAESSSNVTQPKEDITDNINSTPGTTTGKPATMTVHLATPTRSVGIKNGPSLYLSVIVTIFSAYIIC